MYTNAIKLVFNLNLPRLQIVSIPAEFLNLLD